MGASSLTGEESDTNSRTSDSEEFGSDDFPVALARLEAAVLDACARKDEWPAQVAAGVCAGVDFAIANPVIARSLTVTSALETGNTKRYERLIGRLAGFIQVRAPVGTRMPTSTDEALVAGIVGLVGDHIRIGRVERLSELRGELVLLTLLPYLGFAEAQRWADGATASST